MLRRYPRPGVPFSRRVDPVPAAVRAAVRARDGGCVLAWLGIYHDCRGALELDHARASGALGKRSRSTADNLVTLCPVAHRMKTRDGRRYRPLLLAWIERTERAMAQGEHA